MKKTGFWMVAMLLPILLHAQSDFAKVKWAGSHQEVYFKKNIQTTIATDSLVRKPFTFAIGPAESLFGEITIFNSVVYYSKPSGVSAKTDTALRPKAVYLQYAQVPKWKEFSIPEYVTNLRQLEEFIEKTVKEERYDLTKPFPFLVQAQIENARIAIAAQKPGTSTLAEEAKVYFEPSNTLADLVGFYGAKQRGIFNQPDSFTHVHLLTQDRKLTGHLEALRFKSAKNKLLLPDWPADQRKQRRKITVQKNAYKDPTF